MDAPNFSSDQVLLVKRYVLYLRRRTFEQDGICWSAPSPERGVRSAPPSSGFACRRLTYFNINILYLLSNGDFPLPMRGSSAQIAAVSGDVIMEFRHVKRGLVSHLCWQCPAKRCALVRQRRNVCGIRVEQVLRASVRIGIALRCRTKYRASPEFQKCAQIGVLRALILRSPASCHLRSSVSAPSQVRRPRVGSVTALRIPRNAHLRGGGARIDGRNGCY